MALPFFDMDMNEIDPAFLGAPVVFDNTPKPAPNPLNRPEIKYNKFIASIVIFVIVTIATGILSKLFVPTDWLKELEMSSTKFAILATLIIDALFLLLIGRRAIIWLVHVYQHYAPDRVRLKCVFVPSCSEYMIMSLQKYGLFIGLFKGIRRLLRCHLPNGGEDYP